MFIDSPLALLRKWLTKDKTVTTEGKYFADAAVIKELNDGKANITDGVSGMAYTDVQQAKTLYATNTIRIGWVSNGGTDKWLYFFVDNTLVLKIRAGKTYG